MSHVNFLLLLVIQSYVDNYSKRKPPILSIGVNLLEFHTHNFTLLLLLCLFLSPFHFHAIWQRFNAFIFVCVSSIHVCVYVCFFPINIHIPCCIGWLADLHSFSLFKHHWKGFLCKICWNLFSCSGRPFCRFTLRFKTERKHYVLVFSFIICCLFCG